ncbi:MAG: family 2A encapsulin nanocompartment cargo protein cysteine desulfurase [Nevskia sp.]|nr:family 2A encapsulin nanocompartment cargo protein cysteine desulfurase [Nevskia sp.]
MPTPTSEDPGFVPPALTPPAGFPDEAALARLANEFFSALPGAAGLSIPAAGYIPQPTPPSSPYVATAQAPAGMQPSAPTAAGAAGPPRVPYSETISTPSAFGTAIPRIGSGQLPDPPPTLAAEPAATLGAAAPTPLGQVQAPASAGTPARPSSSAGGASRPAPYPAPHMETLNTPPLFATTVPQAAGMPQFGTQPPDLPATPVSVPSTPYYFLGEGSGYPSLSRQLPGAQEDLIVPQSYGLPGQDGVQQMLDALLREDRTAAPVAAAPASTGQYPAGQYYFIEPAAPKANAEPPAAPSMSAHPPFDVHAVRRDFPILAEVVNGRPLIWLDNAATTQKPQAVIDRLAYFYTHENSNIHRAAHELAARSTDAYEGARSKVARFLGAASAEEIVFVRGATEAINLVAQSWGKQNLKPGDEIVVTWLEHHANIVPWQQIAAVTGAKLRVAPVDDDGQVLLDEYGKLLGERTKMVAFTQVSNALGTITPVKEMVEMAHRVGARVLVDGAQAVSHMRVNVQALGADFYVFSGHKLFAPTGIGVVYGKSDLLNAMPPWQGGGNMIQDVTFEKTLYHKAPARFEAGTGNIADAVGLGAAIDYLERVGLENIAHYEHGLLEYATLGLRSVPGLRLIGTARDKASVLSFTLQGYRPEDVGTALNREGIAVRAGHHCAQPILRRFGVEATVRPSLAFYNTCQEVDVLVAALQRLARANR